MTEMLTDRYSERLAGVLSCYDRILITGSRVWLWRNVLPFKPMRDHFQYHPAETAFDSK